MSQERRAGNFTQRQQGALYQATEAADDMRLAHVLDFNWARTQGDFRGTQYQYLANTVYENYSMHLTAHRQSSMDRARFLTCLRLLYTEVPPRAANPDTITGTVPGQGGDGGESMKTQENTSPTSGEEPQNTEQENVEIKHESGKKMEYDSGEFSVSHPTNLPIPYPIAGKLETNVHQSGLGALVNIDDAPGQTQTSATLMSRDDKYRKRREELQCLVSTVLYLTEMYGVAQTRGGAQVSQYRRTLTAQSHTMLVQRLARELQATEAGFWAWLHDENTPAARG